MGQGPGETHVDPPTILSWGRDNTHAELPTREALPALVSEIVEELSHDKQTLFTGRTFPGLQITSRSQGQRPKLSLGEVNPLLHTGANQKDVVSSGGHKDGVVYFAWS